MEIIDKIDIKTKKYSSFKKYVENYVSSVLKEKGYTDLDIMDIKLYINWCPAHTDIFKYGLTIGLDSFDNIVMCREYLYDVCWEEAFKNKNRIILNNTLDYMVKHFQQLVIEHYQ